MASHANVKRDEGDVRPIAFNDELAKYFLFWNHRQRENIIIPRTMGPVKIKTRDEKIVESIFESCPFKCALSCVAGE